MKEDVSIRICGDYKQTVNQACKTDVYPLPRVEDMFAKLASRKKFSKIYLKRAYSQLPLDETSKDLTTINTSQGLFR